MSKPFVEKYRPIIFDDIVLDEKNKRIFKNIIKKKYFPNLLLYGPPGVGKTTTATNLINEYYKQNNISGKFNVIHLNASDERGIDIIRNQIKQFVKSNSLFNNPHNLKFIILDEVDYMTKNAQCALKYLLQTTTSHVNIRFCLICNYISKLDEALQKEFICIKFNNLPKSHIYNLIVNILNNEKIILTNETIDNIIDKYQTDIRSMINFIQLNQYNSFDIINCKTWDILYSTLFSLDETTILNFIYDISIKFHMDVKTIIINFFNYVIKKSNIICTNQLLDIIDYIIHNYEANDTILIKYLFNNKLKIVVK
jgi:DNA polymerase III delta prime subunit